MSTLLFQILVDRITLHYFLFIFDMTKQKEQLQSSVLDLMCHVQFGEIVTDHIQIRSAYVVIMSDCKFCFVSNGRNFIVIK